MPNIENVLEAYGGKLVGTYVDNSTGGGSGHTIEDAAGNDLQQQDTLQFLGSLKATNDSTNGKTLVDDSPTIVTWEAWNAMTPEQRAAIPKAQITNVPGADGVINADLFKELWRNPSPTASFAAQTITLNSADYDFLMIICVSYGLVTSQIIEKGQEAWLMWNNVSSGTNIVISRRGVISATETRLSVEDAYAQTTGSSFQADNNYCIPLAIYGFKSTLALKFSAIAAELSTRADHCFLSDETTSVEDALTKHTFGTAVDISSYTSFNQYEVPCDGYFHIGANGGVHNILAYINSQLMMLVKYDNTLGGDHNSIFVRKGMTLYATKGGTPTSSVIEFIPLQ